MDDRAYKLERNADGNCDCGKCGGSLFSNHPYVFGWVTCDGCGEQYDSPELKRFDAYGITKEEVMEGMRWADEWRERNPMGQKIIAAPAKP